MKLPYSKPEQCTSAADFERLDEICSNCSVKDLCLPFGFTPEELSDLDNIITECRAFKRKQHIFEVNDPFHGLYAIQSGAVKCYRLNSAGDEEVIGFYLPGELIGLEAIHNQRHEFSVTCLAATNVCRIELERLLNAATRMPNLQRQLLNLMSQRLAEHEGQLQQRTAEQKVAVFLLNLSHRYRLRGYPADVFALPMSRQDIGNHLHLATETVSRVITHFQQQGILSAQSKQIALKSLAALERLAL